MEIEINSGILKRAVYDEVMHSIKIYYQNVERLKSFDGVPESIALGLKNAENKDDFYTNYILPLDPEYKARKDKK